MGWETEIPDVVAGQPVESAWGNEVRDKLVHVIPTVAALPVDVPDGGVAYVEDIDRLYVFRVGAWGPVGAGGILGYAQVVANQGGITTITDLTGLTLTFTVPAGRRIQITGQAFLRIEGSSPSIMQAMGSIREGSTVLGRFGSFLLESSSAVRGEVCNGSVILAPTAGAHTYKLSLERSLGSTVNVGMLASATDPAFILAEDIGPA